MTFADLASTFHQHPLLSCYTAIISVSVAPQKTRACLARIHKLYEGVWKFIVDCYATTRQGIARLREIRLEHAAKVEAASPRRMESATASIGRAPS